MGFHNIVYGASEAKAIATFLFGYLGSTLTLLSGSFIMWYIWHYLNNIFAKIAEIAPRNADVIFISILFLVLFTFFYLGMEIWAWQIRKKKKEKDYQSFG